jgi:hypothetical protein
MDVRATLDRLKLLAGGVVVIGTASAWLLVFQSGWRGGDWTGFWSDSEQTRGDAVSIAGRRVETPVEREKRLGITGDHVNDTIYEAKKEVLGDRSRTQGDEVRRERGRIPEMYRYTEREACMEMKMEFPDRYKDVDCMSADMSDDPWLGGPPRGEDDDKDKDKDKAADDPVPARLARSRLAARLPGLRADDPATAPDPTLPGADPGAPGMDDDVVEDPYAVPVNAVEPHDPLLFSDRKLAPRDPMDEPGAAHPR